MTIDKANLKKILLVAIFILVAGGIGVLLYITFFNPPSPPANTNAGNANFVAPNINLAPNGNISLINGLSNQPPNVNFPVNAASDVAQGGATKVKDIPDTYSLGQTIGKDGNIYYYDYLKEKFYRITPDGKVIPLSDKEFFNVDKVTWSSDNQRAILEYPDGKKILYNFTENKPITLPDHWQDFAFSPQGDNFAFKSLGDEPENRWLAITDGNASKIDVITPLNAQNDTVEVNWSPNGQIIASYTSQLDAERQELYFIGKNDENFKYTIIDGGGFQDQWSTSGNRLLYSVYNSGSSGKPELWIVDASGDNIGNNRHNLKINTWAQKCRFASDAAIYCAVPEYLPDQSGVFPELANSIPDNIYKIDLENGSTSLVAIPDGSYTIDNLFVDTNESNLFFTEKGLGKVHSIKLK